MQTKRTVNKYICLCMVEPYSSQLLGLMNGTVNNEEDNVAVATSPRKITINNETWYKITT